MEYQRPLWRPRRQANRWLLLLASLLVVSSACATLTGDEAGDDEADVVAGSDADSDEERDGDDPEDEEVASATTAIEPSEDVEATDPPPVEMPDLIGLTEAEARAELSDLGLEEPSVTGQESFERAGTVLEQVPSSGRVVTGTISLVVAESIPPLPDFVGSPIAEVRSWAGPRGVEVREETRLTTDEAAGMVLDQVPAPGAQASQELIVTIAEAPTIVELVDLGTVNSRCHEVADISMSGEPFPNSTTFGATCFGDSFFAEYNLSRDWSTLRMTLGLDDELSSDAAVQVDFKLDGQSIRSETVVFGETTDIELDVTDGLRLQVVGTKLSGDKSRLGLGNAELLGGSSGTG